MTRPNNLWLRVWLLLVWCVLSALNSLWILPTLLAHGVITKNSWVESVLYTIVATAVMAVIWFKLKHPDCSCWDDVRYEPAKNIDCPDEKPYSASPKYGIDKQGNTTFI